MIQTQKKKEQVLKKRGTEAAPQGKVTKEPEEAPQEEEVSKEPKKKKILKKKAKTE